MAFSKRSEEVVVVTGGAGFLGQHIVKHLLQQTEFPIREIRVFDVKPLRWHPGLDHVKEKPNDITIKQCIGDLCHLEDVHNAFTGATVIIHNASIVDVTSLPDTEKLYKVNVIGTQNVIQACTDNNIDILIYTSSASADIELGYYGDCKSQAERLTLQANKRPLNNGHHIRTCALRLPALYGEGGTILLGSLKLGIIGNTFYPFGDKISTCQAAYAGNMAWAFVAAIRQLRGTAPSGVAARDPAGHAVGVTDDTPLTTYCVHLEPFLQKLRVKTSSFIIPFWFLYILAKICEWLCIMLQPLHILKLPLSTVALDHMCRLPVFDGDDAKLYLGYKPLYSFEESVKKTMVYLEQELDYIIK